MKRLLSTALLVSLALAACSDASDETTTPPEPVKSVELTFRTWDEASIPAYEESFDAFTAANPSITVTIETIDEDEYWQRLESDLDAGTAADVFWLNPANVADHARDDEIVTIETVRSDWEEHLVDLFTVDDDLRAVPQMWNSVALYYNRDLYSEVDTRVENLTWGTEEDTLLATARQLTLDAEGRTAGSDDFDQDSIVQYGFSPDPDLTTAFVPFLVQAGGQFQAEDGTFTFANEAGELSTQYLVDLVNTATVSPELVEDDDAQDLFRDGNLVLYQSDSDSLATIAAEADFDWAIAPIVGGPDGKISVLDGVAAAGYAGSDHPDEVLLLLEWLGTAQGQDPLAANGIAFPAALRAQDTYVNYWAKEGVDVSVFIESSSNSVTISSHNLDIHSALETIQSSYRDMLRGDLSVDEGLSEAQQAGNAALR